MDRVWHNIYIGNVFEAGERGNEFDAVMSVMDLSEYKSEERNAFFHQHNIQIVSHYLTYVTEWDAELEMKVTKDVYAEPEKLNNTVALLDMLVQRKCKTLLHCAAGQERSPLALVWYLYIYQHYTLDEAFAYVKKQHPATLDRLTWLKRMTMRPSLKE